MLQLEAALNSASFFDMEPTVLPDGSAIYFVNDSQGSLDLYRARRSGTTWMTPMLAPGPNVNSSDYDEEYPLISADDLTLYFASDRPGGAGALDIYVAKRTGTALPFGDPVRLAEPNTAVTEIPSWISSDGCELWLSRAATGGHDLMVARRPR
jgi:hypothetical protein